MYIHVYTAGRRRIIISLFGGLVNRNLIYKRRAGALKSAPRERTNRPHKVQTENLCPLHRTQYNYNYRARTSASQRGLDELLVILKSTQLCVDTRFRVHVISCPR